MARTLTVGIVQAAPVHLALEASLDRAEGLARRAAAGGAGLVVFGETWLTGYPAWLDHTPGAALWNHAPTRRMAAALHHAAVVVPGPVTERLGRLCAELGVVLVVGIHERVDEGPGNGTLYNAVLIVDADGRIANHHRKLVPTYTERLVWGPGDGEGLRAVDTAVGRVGALVCWEHWMPLARQALHDSGEVVHVALWPTVNEAHQLASRHYAFEGRCYVVAAGSIQRRADLPEDLRPPGDPDGLLLGGGSAVYGPDGGMVLEPVYDREDVLLAGLDLDKVWEERLTLDVSGHYARPDVLALTVHRKRR